MKDHPKEYRQATQTTLEERLKELNGGGPLTDFEKKMVTGWGTKGENNPTLTPIKGVDSKGEKFDKEVQAYKLTLGVSGDRQTTYYDRNGNVLRDTAHKEAPLVNEGLGPIEYLGYAQLAKQIITKVGQKVGQNAAAREAEAVAKAETSAAAKGSSSTGKPSQTPDASARPREQWQDVNVANKQGGPGQSPRTDPGRASTQQAPAPDPKGGGPLDHAQPKMAYDKTQPGGPPPNANAPAHAPQQPAPRSGTAADSQSTLPPQRGRTNADDRPELIEGTVMQHTPYKSQTPNIPGSKPITIKTANGQERQMKVGEYREQVDKAREWVSEQLQKYPGSGKSHDFQAIYKEAAEKFGLDKNWASINNPYTQGRLPPLVGQD